MSRNNTKYTYNAKNGEPTIFSTQANNIYIKSLFGLTCGLGNGSREFFYIRTDSGIIDNTNLYLIRSTFKKNNFSMKFRTKDEKLILKSNWSFCGNTGVISRQDKLINTVSVK